MSKLRALITFFPAGRPGLGLLLLRAILGITFVLEGVSLLQTWRFGVTALGLLDLASAACLLIGLFTPVAAGVGGLSAALRALAWLPPAHSIALDHTWPFVFVAAVAAAVALLGPGAYSLDARLFGLREIIIPRASDPR